MEKSDLVAGSFFSSATGGSVSIASAGGVTKRKADMITIKKQAQIVEQTEIFKIFGTVEWKYICFFTEYASF
ncbi:MAG: hypothetical protein HQK61_01855 [Desulfamplus sp.]|nr:hypothetical protein [Desulfamplus sp.]